MIPIFPPELLYHVTESTTFPADDLTRIARSSRTLLPLARKLLYRSVQVYFDKGVGYVFLIPGQSLPLA